MAVGVKDALEKEGIYAAVVSMPCWELFEKQSLAYQQKVLGKAPRVAIEAASSFGWERWTGSDGLVCGVDDFGISAPAKEVYAHFNLTDKQLTDKIKVFIEGKHV